MCNTFQFHASVSRSHVQVFLCETCFSTYTMYSTHIIMQLIAYIKNNLISNYWSSCSSFNLLIISPPCIPSLVYLDLTMLGSKPSYHAFPYSPFPTYPPCFLPFFPFPLTCNTYIFPFYIMQTPSFPFLPCFPPPLPPTCNKEDEGG